MKKRVRTSKSNNNELKGLGGWLILVTVTIFLVLLTYFLFALIQVINLILGKINLSIASWLVLSIVYIVLFGYCLYLEFKHRKEFPTWFLTSMWISSILTIIIDQIQKSKVISSWWTIFVTLIWTWYFVKSKRVKNTFVK